MLCRVLILLAWGVIALDAWASDPISEVYPAAANSGCLKCHAGIELIREAGSEMMDQIMDQGQAAGDPAGCVVCHGGDPSITEDKDAAHAGDFFPPRPVRGSTNRPAASAIKTTCGSSGRA